MDWIPAMDRPWRAAPADLVRFFAKVAPEPMSGCWLWIGGGGKGYGTFHVGGRGVAAHRWAWEALNGPIDPDLEADHRCRVRCCVNPSHIRPVTSRENTLEPRSEAPTAINSRKTECPGCGQPYDSERQTRRGLFRECSACTRAADRTKRRRQLATLKAAGDPTAIAAYRAKKNARGKGLLERWRVEDPERYARRAERARERARQSRARKGRPQ